MKVQFKESIDAVVGEQSFYLKSETAAYGLEHSAVDRDNIKTKENLGQTQSLLLDDLISAKKVSQPPNKKGRPRVDKKAFNCAHTDQPHLGLGLCKKCYDKNNRKHR